MRLQHCHYTGYVSVTACARVRVFMCVPACMHARVTRVHHASCHLAQFIKLPLSHVGPVSPLPSLRRRSPLTLTLTLPVSLLHPPSALAALTALRRLHRREGGGALGG